MIKTNYIIEDNKMNLSLKKLGIIGVIATQFLLSGCGPQEKPPVEDPITDIDEYIKKDDEVILVNGEEKTIKELKEEHGYLYHMFVDYSDKDIEDIYNNAINLNFQRSEYNQKNWDKIKTLEIPQIDAFGYLTYNDGRDKDFMDKRGILTKELIQKIFNSNVNSISQFKKYIQKDGDSIFSSFSPDFYKVLTKVDSEKLILKSVNEKRDHVILYLTDLEIYRQAAFETGYPLEKTKDIDFKTNFINDKNYV